MFHLHDKWYEAPGCLVSFNGQTVGTGISTQIQALVVGEENLLCSLTDTSRDSVVNLESESVLLSKSNNGQEWLNKWGDPQWFICLFTANLC
jgi:hypothetical protein